MTTFHYDMADRFARGRRCANEYFWQEKAGVGAAGLLTAALALGGAPALGEIAEPVPVPSGAAVVLQEVIAEDRGDGATTLRFRFLAPDLVHSEADTGAEADMDHLCAEYALPYLDRLGEVPGQIVISLADRAVAFGEISPETTQFFEAYRVEGGACVWEGL